MKHVTIGLVCLGITVAIPLIAAFGPTSEGVSQVAQTRTAAPIKIEQYSVPDRDPNLALAGITAQNLKSRQ